MPSSRTTTCFLAIVRIREADKSIGSPTRWARETRIRPCSASLMRYFVPGLLETRPQFRRYVGLGSTACLEHLTALFQVLVHLRAVSGIVLDCPTDLFETQRRKIISDCLGRAA